MRSEKLFRPFIRLMFNSHCGGIRLDEVSLMKRIGALLLCGILLLPAAGASGTPWPAWAAEALAWGREKSVSRAFLASPGQRLTRGAVARLLYESAAHEECPFSDVSEKDAAAVGWAAGQGYLTGVGDGTYEPGRPVTRQEFAAILWRQAGTPEVPVQGLERFGDAGTVSEWARDAVLWCQQAGVMAGRSGDKLAPEDTITTAEALVMLERAAGLPDVGQLRDDLEILAAHHRPVGSQGEADAVRYLRDRFEEMGYSVTLQPYTDGQGRTGHNVAAVKAASVPDADILVLSAHHDSVPTAYGANDNASGVAALLYTAEALRNVPTDTEVRFLSFTDEENGKNGSRTYTASLTEEERTRIVGAIQFDMLGADIRDFPVYASPAEFQGEADVVVDFSSPSALPALLSFGLEHRMPLVLATTGYDQGQLEEIQQAARSIPIFRSANLSLGVNILVELVRRTAAVLGGSCDIEIVERHHNKKMDAPSGTALMLAEAAADALPCQPELVCGRQGIRRSRERCEIGISSMRGGGIVGDHEVLFAGRDELIELRHSALSREVFASGAVQAARFLAAGQSPGLYSMADLVTYLGL